MSNINPTDTVPTVTSNTPVTGVPSLVSGITTLTEASGVGVGVKVGVGVGVGVKVGVGVGVGVKVGVGVGVGVGVLLATLLGLGETDVELGV